MTVGRVGDYSMCSRRAVSRKEVFLARSRLPGTRCEAEGLRHRDGALRNLRIARRRTLIHRTSEIPLVHDDVPRHRGGNCERQPSMAGKEYARLTVFQIAHSYLPTSSLMRNRSKKIDTMRITPIAII